MGWRNQGSHPSESTKSTPPTPVLPPVLPPPTTNHQPPSPTRVVCPMWALSTRRLAGEIKKNTYTNCSAALPRLSSNLLAGLRRLEDDPDDAGTRRAPFILTPMAVNPISSRSPHVRCTPMGRTCGEPDEIKKIPHPKYFTALFREQAPTPDGKTKFHTVERDSGTRAVQYHPHGGQFGFVWLPARTRHGAYVW